MAQVPRFLNRVFYPFPFGMNNSCRAEVRQWACVASKQRGLGLTKPAHWSPWARLFIPVVNKCSDHLESLLHNLNFHWKFSPCLLHISHRRSAWDGLSLLTNFIFSFSCASPLWEVLRLPSEEEEFWRKRPTHSLFFKEKAFIYSTCVNWREKQMNKEGHAPCVLLSTNYRKERLCETCLHFPEARNLLSQVITYLHKLMFRFHTVGLCLLMDLM